MTAYASHQYSYEVQASFAALFHARTESRNGVSEAKLSLNFQECGDFSSANKCHEKQEVEYLVWNSGYRRVLDVSGKNKLF